MCSTFWWAFHLADATAFNPPASLGGRGADFLFHLLRVGVSEQAHLFTPRELETCRAGMPGAPTSLAFGTDSLSQGPRRCLSTVGRKEDHQGPLGRADTRHGEVTRRQGVAIGSVGGAHRAPSSGQLSLGPDQGSFHCVFGIILKVRQSGYSEPSIPRWHHRTVLCTLSALGSSCPGLAVGKDSSLNPYLKPWRGAES